MSGDFNQGLAVAVAPCVPAVLRGDARPRDAADCLAFAQLSLF
jgi:hypothetical protein